VRAVARRLAGAVEPVIEEAYHLTQAGLGRATASGPEGAESPGLVHNTFNITVNLCSDEASARVDPAALADALSDVLRSSARRHGLEI
jgi:hypothetical protein